jgi:hypothetical protein
VRDSSILEYLSVYKKSSRKDAKIAKDAKLLLVILSLYFQDSYYFECNMSCITRIYRTGTLRLCALARGNFGIMFIRF